jgi:C-5 cytosine-specific DNA methylase
MGRAKQSVVPQKGTTLTQLFRRVPAEDRGHHIMFADVLPETAWYEEFGDRGEDDSAHMFESMDDSAFIEVYDQCEGIQGEETTDPLDRKSSSAPAMNCPNREGSLLPPKQDSPSSVLTAASTSTVPTPVDAAAAAAALALPSAASPASIGGSPHSYGAARKLKPNPYLSIMKRSHSVPGVLKAGDDGPEPKKHRTEALEGDPTAVVAVNGSASHQEPESSSRHEQPGDVDETHTQGDRHGASLESRRASNGSTTVTVTASAATATIIVASSRSRCLVIGPSPKRNLNESFEKSAAEATSRAPIASQSEQGPVDQKYEISREPRRAQFRDLEFKVGDTFICSIPKAKTSKRAKGRTEDDKCFVFTILGFVVGKDRAVVEERLELKDTFLGANFDSTTNQVWINRYGSSYLAGGKKHWPLRLFNRKVESVPTSNIHYSGIDKGDNRNFVYRFHTVHDTDVRERVLPRKPVALELFAGGGGMSLGLKDAGFDVKYVVEKNFVFAHTLERNFDRLNLDYKMYNEDVLDFLDKIRNEVPEYPRNGDVDHIHASSPCQGFSRANRYVSMEFVSDYSHLLLLSPSPIIILSSRVKKWRTRRHAQQRIVEDFCRGD